MLLLVHAELCVCEMPRHVWLRHTKCVRQLADAQFRMDQQQHQAAQARLV